jgi:hypothetical protein
MISREDLFFELRISDLILEVVDDAQVMTRSDAQGRAQAVAKQIIRDVSARALNNPKGGDRDERAGADDRQNPGNP